MEPKFYIKNKKILSVDWPVPKYQDGEIIGKKLVNIKSDSFFLFRGDEGHIDEIYIKSIEKGPSYPLVYYKLNNSKKVHVTNFHQFVVIFMKQFEYNYAVKVSPELLVIYPANLSENLQNFLAELYESGNNLPYLMDRDLIKTLIEDSKADFELYPDEDWTNYKKEFWPFLEWLLEVSSTDYIIIESYYKDF